MEKIIRLDGLLSSFLPVSFENFGQHYIDYRCNLYYVKVVFTTVRRRHFSAFAAPRPGTKKGPRRSGARFSTLARGYTIGLLFPVSKVLFLDKLIACILAFRIRAHQFNLYLGIITNKVPCRYYRRFATFRAAYIIIHLISFQDPRQAFFCIPDSVLNSQKEIVQVGFI